MSALATLVGGFASGVFLRSLFFTSWWPFVFVLLLAFILSIATFFVPRRAYSLAAVFCLCLAIGGLRTALSESPLPSVFVADLKHRVSYVAVVVGDPDLRDANQRVPILVKKGGTATKMLAVAPREPTVRVGDTIYVSGTLDLPRPFLDDNGRVFKYDKYLEREGIRFLLNFAYLRIEQSATSVPFKIRFLAVFAQIKHMFIDGLTSSLPEPHASLASGIVIGGKSGLGNELKEAFTRSGLVQIIVLSGYNVMVVAEWVMTFFALFLSRRKSVVAGGVALIFFVLTAGLTATAVRAALMALIALYALHTGRSYAASRALLLVVFLMLLWNPLYLAFDPGFSLSIAATAGLIWLAPAIEQSLSRFRRVCQVQRSETLSEKANGSAKNGFLLNATATTLAAQIAVLPLLLYFTGNLSLVSIPANILAMPIIPIAMALSAFAGIMGIIFSSFLPALATILGTPSYLANAFLIFIAEGSASLPFANVVLPAFPFWLALTAYAALIYFIAKLNRSSIAPQFTLAKKAST